MRCSRIEEQGPRSDGKLRGGSGVVYSAGLAPDLSGGGGRTLSFFDADRIACGSVLIKLTGI